MSCSTTMTVLPGVHQPLELRQQPVDIRGMQSGRGLVEDIQRIAAARTLQLGGEFDALGFAARKLGGRLAQVAGSPSPLRAARQRACTAGRLRKMRSAASTVMASTSAIVSVRDSGSPASSRCSACRDKSGQGVYTLGMNSSSTITKPSPSQCSHRPLATLKEKRPAS